MTVPVGLSPPATVAVSSIAVPTVVLEGFAVVLITTLLAGLTTTGSEASLLLAMLSLNDIAQ